MLGRSSVSPDARHAVRKAASCPSSCATICADRPGGSRASRLRCQPGSPSTGKLQGSSMPRRGFLAPSALGAQPGAIEGGGRTTVELSPRRARTNRKRSPSRGARCGSTRTDTSSSGETCWWLQTGHFCQNLPLYSWRLRKYRRMQGAQKTWPQRVIFGTTISSSRQIGHFNNSSLQRSTRRTLDQSRSASAFNVASTTSGVISSTRIRNEFCTKRPFEKDAGLAPRPPEAPEAPPAPAPAPPPDEAPPFGRDRRVGGVYCCRWLDGGR
mmetsp:Transcript_114951/g.330115  ORF Transcript_114951/g.330115 Transcript_114951/m.330115 type:complete len:269 (+) Transcript_114951:894-1700(+)